WTWSQRRMPSQPAASARTARATRRSGSAKVGTLRARRGRRPPRWWSAGRRSCPNHARGSGRDPAGVARQPSGSKGAVIARRVLPLAVLVVAVLAAVWFVALDQGSDALIPSAPDGLSVERLHLAV